MDTGAGPSTSTGYRGGIRNSSDGRTWSSAAQTHRPFESLMSDSSEEDDELICQKPCNFEKAIPRDENLSSLKTDKRLSCSFLLSDESSDEEADLCIGLPENTTFGAAIEENKADPTKQSSVDLSSELSTEEIVLSVIYQNSHLGAAYYNTVTSELYVLEDIAESYLNFDVTNLIYRQSRPSFIVTISGMKDHFLVLLKKLISEENENCSNDTPSSHNRLTRLRFKIMSKIEYSFSSCLTRVQHLKLETEPEDLNADERVLFLSSIINFNCSIMIHALGLLLKYLDKNWNAMELDAIGQAKFMQLQKLNLKDIVTIDNETFKALQIVNPRHHPSLFKFGNTRSCREGLSLYSLLNRCQSRPGVQCLWKHPTCDVREITERLDVIEFCLDPKNQHIIEGILPCLSKICQITKVMNRLSAPQAKASEWQRLHKTLCNIIHIVDICMPYKDASPLFKKIVDGATEEMYRLRYFIEYIVDVDASRQQNKFVAKTGVDPELDQLNHENQVLPQVLSVMAAKELQNLPNSVKACSMVYLPDIGYLLAITKWEDTPPIDNELPGLEFKFIANNIAHYKSPATTELQNTFGDVLEKITKKQSQIMMQLVQYITKHMNPILEIIKHIAKLDALISMSMVARDLNYVRPTISQVKIIDIKQGRHPLLEVINTSYIANNTFSGQEKSLIKIITGPNASGKSVYLKQVALIVFMAHIGSYVPAESATIGVISHIFTRIHFLDSMASNASSFMIDLRQMNKAISETSPDSLVVIDEFGKGTSYVDALSLLSAYLTDFINRGTKCPHIFVSTHLHDVVNWIPQTSIVETQTFEFLINEDSAVVFLYKIIKGTSGTSFAHAVAAAAGLDPKIVERSKLIYEARGRNEPLIKLSRLDVCHRERLAKKICKHLMDENEFIDMDGLQMCIKQMWTTEFRNQSSSAYDTTST